MVATEALMRIHRLYRRSRVIWNYGLALACRSCLVGEAQYDSQDLLYGALSRNTARVKMTWSISADKRESTHSMQTTSLVYVSAKTGAGGYARSAQSAPGAIEWVDLSERWNRFSWFGTLYG